MASEGSMRPVRWGLLGTGSITDKVVPGARRSDRVTFVAAGSRTLERAEAYAAPKGIARAHGSYEALLDDPEVEAVYISLPNSLHHEWTMHALRAGKHVLCEKPYSTREADVHEAYDLADARGLVLSEGFMWRHHPQAARAARDAPGARRAADDPGHLRVCDGRRPGDGHPPPGRSRRRFTDGRRAATASAVRGCSPGRSLRPSTGARSGARRASTCASPAC